MQKGNKAVPISVKFTPNRTTNIYYHSFAEDEDYPSIMQETKFNYISTPFNFSVGVTYFEGRGLRYYCKLP